MAGTLKFDTWVNDNGSENYKCRAWVNFNGTGTVAIRASGNVSSVADNGTGNYTVNFTTAMPDADYSTVLSGNAFRARVGNISSGTTTASPSLEAWNSSNALADADFMNVAIFR